MSHHDRRRSQLTFSRRRFIQGGAALGAAAAATAIAPDFARGASGLLSPARALDLSDVTILATFNAGSGPQEIGVRDLAGTPPGGPQALCARRDGSIAVLDTINRRIAVVRGSNIVSTIPIPEAIFPIDIQESAGELIVLDPAGEQLLRVTTAGTRRVAITKDRRSSVSRLSPTGTGGTVGLIDEDAGSSTFQLDGQTQPSYRRGAFSDGAAGSMAFTYPAATPDTRRSVRVERGSTSFGVEVLDPLGSVVPLGTDASGYLYLLVTELVDSNVGGLDVDLTVRRYAWDGRLAAMARVPVRGRWSQPQSAVSISPSGDALALVPERTRTHIVQLHWGSTIRALRPIRAFLPANFGIANAATPIPNTRAQATAKAQTFYNYQWTATSAMLTRSCGTAGLPSYITGPGTYFEIPYCWGAWDEPGAYVQRINSPYNYHLGDNNGGSGGWKGCTAGADCSGFIQQCWGIGGSKQNTETLLNWVTNAPGQSQSQGGTLYPGDMWRLPQTHARLHYSYPPDHTGDYMYEASIDWGERVWFAFRPWSQYTNYLWCLGYFLS